MIEHHHIFHSTRVECAELSHDCLVQTKGPDKVAAHRHPMLEQLFPGLSENQCTVHADDNRVDFTPCSVLHIPLGSNHSVSVEEGKNLYYVWMDFFLDKQGEDWLKNHRNAK